MLQRMFAHLILWPLLLSTFWLTCVFGIWPVNPNIFTDDEYLSSSVTDRLDPSLNCQNNNFPEKELESSMMELDVYVSNSDISDAGPSTSNSNLCVTPEQIRPFPKAKSRSKSNIGGREQGRCRILTEREEIERTYAIKIAKKRKLVKKTELEIEANSSEELSNIEDSNSTDELCFCPLKKSGPWYTPTYGNGPQRNHGFENRNRFDRDNHGFECSNGRSSRQSPRQSRNSRQRDRLETNGANRRTASLEILIGDVKDRRKN
ncbi:casein kinase I isoform alpha [Trichonephila clavipes]|nr:casein kinase I isoform alpha [Trichonephila clavipes]